MVRLRDIAAQAGTSVGTVSLVLNGRQGNVRISERTRRAVVEAAHTLGYSPNLAARRLRTKGHAARRSLAIAVAHPVDSRLSLVSRILAGVQRQIDEARQELEELGYDVQVTVERYVPGELHRLRGLGEALWYNGVLITNTSIEDDELLDRQEPGVPVVLFQRYSARSYVNVDNRAAGAEVAEHLLGLGHRRLAILTPGISAQVQSLRLEGFDRRVRAVGLPPVEHACAPGSSWVHDAYEVVGGLLDRPASDRPTAIFATNDLLALGVMRAAHERGLRVPEQLAVVGFDDSELAPYMVPSLTSVHLPVEEMAAEATAILLDLMQRRTAGPVQRILPTRLVVRESCGTRINAGEE